MPDFLDNVIELRVAIPQQRSENFGVYSTRHESAQRKTVRFTGPEIAAIEKWCAIMEMSFSSFVRDAAANVAIALDKLEKSNANRSNHGGG